MRAILGAQVRVLELQPGNGMAIQEGRAPTSETYMGYFVRPMRAEDIDQVAVVEQECFPTGWGPTPFLRELSNKSAAYLVACRATDPGHAHEEARIASPETATVTAKPALLRWADRLKRVLSPPHLPVQDFSQHVSGYVGLWYVTDEAHITSIGTREQARRQGIGELLVIASRELAQRHGSRVMTLEARVSNHPAHGLYNKYGFEEVGIRKAYYVDNRENAVIMTTGNIQSEENRREFARLIKEHTQRWGFSVRNIG